MTKFHLRPLFFILLFLVSACNKDPIQGVGTNSNFSGDMYPYPNVSPVASAITPNAFNEDTQKLVTLAYSDPEGDLATSCSVSLPSHVSITQACACNGLGVCTVGVTGDLNYNGPASFYYQVTTNALSNTALAILTITAVDDAPVATGINNVAILKSVDTVVTLNYTDIENDHATTCTISNANYISISSGCACTAGVCTVTVRGSEDNSYSLPGATNAIGFSYFSYSVSSNGSTSTPYSVTATCPIGYVPVTGNAGLGTDDFCVMRYEASTVGVGTSAKSHPAGTLINSINIYDAANKCTALGSKFDLITNSEWMTLARDIEVQDANWSNGSSYDGCLMRGNLPGGGIDDCTYDAGIPDESGYGRNGKAKHVLSNGSEVWDMGGNLTEWILWKAQSDTTSTVQNTIDQSNTDITFCSSGEVDMNNCPGITVGDLEPLNGTLSSLETIGILTGLNAPSANVASLRGLEGVFGMSRAYHASDDEPEFGFRCVYRP